VVRAPRAALLPAAEAGESLGEEGVQRALVQRADMGADHLAALEQQQGGDVADAVLGGQRAVLVHVDLGDLDLARVLVGGLVEQGRDGLAGAAPDGPEVDEHRLGRADDLGLKAVGAGVDDLVVDFDRFLETCMDYWKMQMTVDMVCVYVCMCVRVHVFV
jgi:hypothetical protein